MFSGKRLAEIGFGGEKPPHPKGKAPESFRKQLLDYFEGRLREFRQDIQFFQGTDFERRVWLSLKDIHYGETRTYKWLAEKAGSPKGSRAVGQALSKNPLPIIIPCHRVIESDGSLGDTRGEPISREGCSIWNITISSGRNKGEEI